MGDVQATKPRWTTASFLLYAGGLTVLAAGVGALAYLSTQYGRGAYAGWALLILLVLSAIAHAFRRRDRRTAAGVFAFASVVAWGFFVGALFAWFGWLSSRQPFSDFCFARLLLELLVLAAALSYLRRFRFPLIAAIVVYVTWFFVIDLVTNGGDSTAAITLVVGLVYLLAGGRSARPTAFWWNLGAGTLIGGAILYWLHSTDADWAVICVAALAYVRIAYATRRSSWAVLAAGALLAAGAHFTAEWSHGSLTLSPAAVSTFRGWVPSLVFAFVGFLLVALGLAARRPAPGAE